MDPLSLVLVLAAAAAGVTAVLWYRRRLVERARMGLRQAETDFLGIEAALATYVRTGDYIPESVRRPLHAKVLRIVDGTLPPFAKAVRRVRGKGMQRQLEAVFRHGNELRRVLEGHNDQYVDRMMTEHSKLLVDDLKADQGQRTAIVRDDVRNLVIAGAGSGKTRTIVGRIRFLLERHVLPTAILAVTFTNKATEEMQDRLQQMGVPIADREKGGVTVSTLHSLGKRVVQATSPGPLSVADDRWTNSLVAKVLGDARTAKNQGLTQLYLRSILHFNRSEDETEPSVGTDKTYRTLRGEHVRSIGERMIADALFFNHVEYKYEARASWADVGSDRGAYHPDFTLPGHDACIEYWGINRAGEVPAGWATSSAEYKQGMDWKRDQFRHEGKLLIEFYEYERTEGTLEDALRERLTGSGIVLRPMTLEEVGKSISDLKYIGSALETLLVQFITNARALRRAPDGIRSHLNKATPRVYHFGLLGIAVLERYHAALAAEGRIDFSDMLHRAADILEGGTNPLPTFEHVLVDEFQDTSPAMARFLKALVAATGAHLFAVGDDWQAIYGFAGGDVDYLINFESHFGPASMTMLNVNYRSPRLIVEAGGALIAHNANQVPKQVVVASRERGEAFVHEVADDDAAIVDRTARLIQEESRLFKPDEVLVLSRTNHLLEDIAEACSQKAISIDNPDRGMAGVRILSAHRAKGLEAKVVIVANASDHLFGFPSKVENPDVLEPVRMSAGNAKAEERRLFYVAITRAMQRVHLITRRGFPSPFLADIEGTGNPSKTFDPARVLPGGRFAGVFYVDRLYPLSEAQAKARIRQVGLLTTPTGRFSFTSWAPFILKPGGTYWLTDVIKDRPYQNQQRVKLDSGTRAEVRAQREPGAEKRGVRELRPRPPPSHQPQILR